jgi:hypothetical protein
MQTLSALVLFIIALTFAARAPQRYRMKNVDGPTLSLATPHGVGRWCFEAFGIPAFLAGLG